VVQHHACSTIPHLHVLLMGAVDEVATGVLRWEIHVLSNLFGLLDNREVDGEGDEVEDTILSINNIQTRGFNKFQTKDMDRVGATTVAVAVEEALGKDMEDRPTAVTVESEN